MITRSMVADAIKVIDRSGLAPFVEAAIDQDKGVGGRPNPLSIRTLLVCAQLTAIHARPMTATSIHNTLAVEVHPRSRQRLGCLRPDGLPFTYEQVARRYRQVINALDGSPHFGGYGLDEETQAEKDNRLQVFCDRLLDATIPLDIPHEGSYALDSTPVETWAHPVGHTTNAKDGSGMSIPERYRKRQPKNGSPLQVHRWGTTDPDAAKFKFKDWHSKAGKWGFGYEVQAAVWIGEEGGQPVPLITARIQVLSHHQGNGRRSVEIFERLALDGYPIGDVVTDAEYPNFNGWSVQMRRLGAQLITHLHKHYLGWKGTIGGALAIDGSLYSPSLPQRLRDIGQIPTAWATRAELEAHMTLEAERAPYQLQRLSARPDDIGNMRFQCPAAAGRIACELKPTSLTLRDTKGQAMPIFVPEPPLDAVCAQSTMRVNITTGDTRDDSSSDDPLVLLGKTYQKHRYGSYEWYGSWNRRSRGEGGFAGVKNRTLQDIRRGIHRYMGRAAASITVALIYAASNLRLIGTYRRKQAKAHKARPEDSILFERWRSQMRRKRAADRHPLAPRRKTAGTQRHRQLTPDGVAALIPDPGPPG